MTIYGLLNSFNPFFFLEVVSTQQAEVVVWVNVVQGEDEINQGLPTVESMSEDSVRVQGCKSRGRCVEAYSDLSPGGLSQRAHRRL